VTNPRQQQPQNTRQDIAQNDAPMSPAMQTLARRKASIARVAEIVRVERPNFERMLPDHLPVATFLAAAGAALHRSEDLMAGAVEDPAEFLIALRESAGLGHVPGTDHYWLTPRKRGGRPSILGIEGYQGIIERMYRSGGVLSVHSDVVREHDTFDLESGQNGRPVHRRAGRWGAFSPESERGQIIGAYAYAMLPGAMASQVVLMSIEQLYDLKAKHAAAGGKIWDQHPEPMMRKSALRRLEPYVPVSAGYRQTMAQATTFAVAAQPSIPARMEDSVENPSQPSPDGPNDTVDGVVVEQDRPVHDVQYDPEEWGGDPGWADMSTARPGDGVPYDPER
jgi:recombination protein RecT